MAYLRSYSVRMPEDIELPFRVKLNFEQLIAFWENLANSGNTADAHKAKALLEKIRKNAPLLLEAFDDLSIIEKHEKELKELFAPIFPALTTNNDIKGVVIPFLPILFNASQRFSKILDAAGDKRINMMRQTDPDVLYINACAFILKFKYGVAINNKQAMYFDIPNKKMGIERHYRAFINADFSSFTPNSDFKPLSEEEIRELINNINDIDLWKAKIPPNSFTYEGFGIVKLFDVTEDEAISTLKVDLLKKDALQTPELIEDIRQHISSLIGIKDVKLGFAAFDKDKDSLKSLGQGYWNSLSLGGKMEQANANAFCSHTKKSLFDQFDPLIFPSYSQENQDNVPFLSNLATNGIKSYIVIPLIYDNQVIGVFELGSEKENELNALVANHLEQVIPLFTTALKRSLDEQETKLEAIVQDQFTAIHPSVSWRFFDAADNLLKRKKEDPKATVEEIIFPEVYPLFGQSDIKGSSTERNSAIQADMIEQLSLVRGIIQKAKTNYRLPIYDQLKYKLDNCIKNMEKGLHAGDEIEILEFLNRDIYPVLEYWTTVGFEMQEAVNAYRQALNPELGVIYKKRKDYEESVQLINNSMGEYLSLAQQRAQKMFPHYFELYKTDGVEHNLYIGQSIVHNKPFNELYLQNLRLWQLMTICETENLMEYEIKPQLKVPLSVASLVLVHHNPITIKFRQEEKRFDVEGAYNIRYEIIKKRIDKAIIKGTTERLTQPGKIAIVYSQDREAREYSQYFDYLQSIKYIKDKVEWLDLSDLQGVTGLKAARIAVNYNSQVETNHIERSVNQGKRNRRKTPILVKT